jgi:phosphate transport system substrate-binding protein
VLKSKVGAIGYAESVGLQLITNLVQHLFKTAAGEFVEPSAAGTSAFLGGGTVNDDGSLVTPYQKAIQGGYSIATASYGLVYPTAAGRRCREAKDCCPMAHISSRAMP